MYNPHTSVHTLNGQGGTWVYLSITPERDAFFFIEAYRSDSPYLEEVPRPEEEAEWMVE
ncbi:MAG: hypothetical protein ACI8Y7_000953 [Candidatus Woesearchaeota archaeon]|jgi:hypothetical protein